MVILQAKINSWYSVIAVESVERGVGVRVRDLLREESLFLTDVGFSQTASANAVIATRLMAPDGIVMTTGAGLPVGLATPAEQVRFVEGIKRILPGVDFRNMTPDQTATLAGVLIRGCLQRGAADQIAYRDAESDRPGDLPDSPRIGRNDPCPCGSGKKFKKCCGSRA
jgi:hypothetical protein